MVDPSSASQSSCTPHAARIAVVAIHGVADQSPNQTARSVADLLLGVQRDAEGPVEYGNFVETTLHIGVQRLDSLRGAAPEAESSHNPQERAILGSEFAAHLDRRSAARAGDEQPPPLDVQFTSAEIARYDVSLDSPSYESICLSAERVGGGTQPRTKVDVYEMFWADLSRLGSGLWRIAGELYQLFFHLSSLGRNTVDLGADANSGSTSWRIYRLLQRLCDWTLAVPIGMLNLYLPLLAVLLALALVPAQHMTTVATVVWALLGGAAGGALMYRSSRQPFRWWIAVQILGIAVGWALGSSQLLPPVQLLVYGALILVFALVLWLARKYDERRPSALHASRAIMLTLGVTILFKAPETAGAQPIIEWVMWRIELVFSVLVVLWALLITGEILTWCAGEWVIWKAATGHSSDPESPRRLARRVVWTGRLGFSVSTSLFVIVTLSVWAALLYVIEHNSGSLFLLRYRPSFEWLGSNPLPLVDYAEALLEQSGGPLFQVFFMCTALSFVLLLWAMVIPIAAELAAPREVNRVASRRLGFWLDHGFRLARVAGSVLVFGLLVALSIGAIVKGATPEGIQSLFDRASLAWLYPRLKGLIGDTGLMSAAGYLLGGTTLGVVALGSRLGKVFGRLRPILDIALDVDNWLREHPVKHNPKSRILARYASLLRYIGKHRDSSGGAYDAVIFVAHSQGTVISADLLRYLRIQPEGWPFNKTTPVYILTMGCPLRQLYGLRFPHLYGWSRYRLPQSAAPLSEREVSIPRTRQPLPDELGVALWVNAYRSGDYVGRRLWIRDDDPARWEPATRDGDAVASDAPGTGGADVPNATRIEFCIGPGAHTHYFDETALRVAEAIDQLIAIATVGKNSYRHGYPAFSS